MLTLNIGTKNSTLATASRSTKISLKRSPNPITWFLINAFTAPKKKGQVSAKSNALFHFGTL